jgi:hypothetical protein
MSLRDDLVDDGVNLAYSHVSGAADWDRPRFSPK